MNHPRALCATAALLALLGASCEDSDDEIDGERVTAPSRPTGTGGGNGASTNTSGSGTGTGSNSTNTPGGAPAGPSTSGGAGTGSSGMAGGAAGAPAAGAAGAGGASGAIIPALPDAGADGGLPPLPADAGAAQLSDGQILTVVDTVNAGEVQQAQAALPRLVDEAVQAFANDMIAEHTAAREQLQTLAQMQGIAPAESELATLLASRSAATVQALQAALAGAVDQLYIGQQVAAHAEALLLLDQLIEAADAPPLEAQLITLRGSVDAHLNRARELSER